VDFFHLGLQHVKGEWANTPFHLERWEQAIVGNLFGWLRPDGSRRYRRAFIAVGRKNGKTPLCAGLALRTWVGEVEPGAEVVSVASTRDQARLVWDWAKGMIHRCPEIKASVKLYQHSMVLNDDPLACYKPIAAEAGGIHGANIHAAIIDELHTLPDRELVDVIETSTGARRQPLIVMITTAGWDRTTICWEKWEYARAVRDGNLNDPQFLPAIWEADESDDWTDEATWAKANPNMGVSIKLDYLRAECEKAKKNPDYENTFRQLHLNMWTQQAKRWIGMDSWRKCAMPFDAAKLAKRPCYAGLDLAHTRDMSALALCFPPCAEYPKFYCIQCYFWLPAHDLKTRELRDFAPYFKWSQAGLLDLTPGAITDYRYIRERIKDIAKHHRIVEIAYDRWNASHLVTELAEEDGLTMTEHGQGYASMSWPSKEFERVILDGKISHGGNPILEWQMNSVALLTDPSGNIKPTKSQDRARIDGVVASIMAVGRAMLAFQKTSVYSTRGILEL